MNFDKIIDRRSSESIKWNYFDEDVLPMWIADLDFKAPDPVIDALNDRVSHGVFGYGCEPEGLKQVIKDHLSNRQDWIVPEEAISFVSGVVTGFTHAIYSLTEPGDKILIQPPVYRPILIGPESIGRICLHNPLVQRESGKYEINFDDFEEKISSGVKLFLLCNPHNPVGRVFTHDELVKMAEICLEHDVLICSDEIHGDLIYSGNQHTPIASLSPEIAAITVTYFAPSKTFNIAGLSTSVYIAENPSLRKQLSESMRLILGHPNILGMQAARAAYENGQEWLDQLLDYLESNRDYLVGYLSQELPGIKMWSPEGTFLAWLDCRDLALEPSPQKFFLEQGKVGFNEGKEFGEGGEGFIRMNFGCPRKQLQEGLERMHSAMINRT